MVIHLPYEYDDNLENVNEHLSKMAVYIDIIDSTLIVTMVGEFTGDISRKSAFGDLLCDFLSQSHDVVIYHSHPFCDVYLLLRSWPSSDYFRSLSACGCRYV